jgi:hypothetical protein
LHIFQEQHGLLQALQRGLCHVRTTLLHRLQMLRSMGL